MSTFDWCENFSNSFRAAESFSAEFRDDFPTESLDCLIVRVRVTCCQIASITGFRQSWFGAPLRPGPEHFNTEMLEQFVRICISIVVFIGRVNLEMRLETNDRFSISGARACTHWEITWKSDNLTMPRWNYNISNIPTRDVPKTRRIKDGRIREFQFLRFRKEKKNINYDIYQIMYFFFCQRYF